MLLKFQKIKCQVQMAFHHKFYQPFKLFYFKIKTKTKWKIRVHLPIYVLSGHKNLDNGTLN